MQVAVAIDSFKGSLTTFEAGEAVAQGVKRVYPNAQVHVCPIADGGEGTVSAIITATGGQMREIIVTGPLGEKITASYGLIPSRQTAVIEMATAAGLPLVETEKRNPLYTTTYGVGEMIKDAIAQGCRQFIVGIGGSATNDGGVGMLQALGFAFLDKDGNQVPFGAIGLKDIAKINTENALKELQNCHFQVACDVKNPLCGANGASYIYARQKGATDEDIAQMDEWLQGYANLTKTVFENADENAEGAGAAGGLGFALLSYFSAKMQSGIDLVIKETGLEEYIKNADVVVTGEGRLDGQSVMGKAPVGVAKLAKKHGKRVIAFSGCIGDNARACNEYIDAYFPIVPRPCSLEEAMQRENAFENLKNTAEQVFRLIKV